MNTIEDKVKTAIELAELVKPTAEEQSEPPPRPSRVFLNRGILEMLVNELREMETADPFNNELRQWAEALVEAFDAITAAYDDIRERMINIRGVVPEVYAHLYLKKQEIVA
jgi:hypothetical protein